MSTLQSTLQGCPTTDNAAFVADITIPDGTVISPNQSFVKTWRLRNTGTSTWGAGYQLAFTGGDQMDAPGSVDMPHNVAPREEVDIRVNMEAPPAGGSYQGDWKMRNAQGVYFGDRVWVKISVPGGPEPAPPPSGGTGDIDVQSVEYPSVVAPGQSFRPRVTVRVNQGQLRESRGDMLRNTDGNLYGAWPHVAVVGTVSAGQTYTFEFYENNPITAPSGEGTYESKWRVWQDGNWAGLEITVRFDVRSGGGTRPDPPTLISPSNWHYARDGTTPTLCASAPAGLQYYFQIYESHDIPESGWISSDCWTPPNLGPYGYQWHVNVRDPGSGLESGWSETWHFNIAEQRLSLDDFRFDPESPSAAERVRVWTCLHGFGEVNISLKLEANSATDGSASGDWYWIHHLGTFCYDRDDSSKWPEWETLPLADGTHLIRATGKGPDGQTLIKETTYTLQRRRPPPIEAIFPIKGVKVNSRTVTFRWKTGMFRGVGDNRATEYQLLVSPNGDPAQNPIVNVTLDTGSTNYTHTFDQDYPELNWRVISRNEKGESEATNSFGIDRIPPSSSVSPIDATTTETTFPVSWSGTDNLAGIRWYDVQYRDGDRGDWTDWQVDVTHIADIFTGQPGHTYYFRSRALDNAGNWEPYPDGNGDTYTRVDPAAASPTSWWDSRYAFKRNLLILNKDSQSLPERYPVHLHFDSSTPVIASELYDASQSSVKGDDFRIVYNNQTELPRFVQTFRSDRIDIWFNLQAGIGPNPASDSGSYQLYFGNPNAGNPPGDVNGVLPPGGDGSTVGLWHFQETSGTSLIDSYGHGHTGTMNNGSRDPNGKFGGAVVFNGSSTTLDLGDHSDFDLRTFTLEGLVFFSAPGTQLLMRRNNTEPTGTAYSLGTRDAKVEYSIDGLAPLRSQTQFQPNRWYHIAATYDGTTLRIFVNGHEEASKTDTYGVPPSAGSLIVGNNRENSDWFSGKMQHIRISNIARTSFPYASFADVLNEPSLAAGDAIEQPQPGSPDLAVQSLITYNSADGALVQAVVTNQGDGATRNGFWVDLYADQQPTGPGDLTGSIRYWIASPIEAGATLTLTTLVTDTQILGSASTLSAKNQTNVLQETTGTLYVQADSKGTVNETNRGNNISSGVEVCLASADAFETDDTTASATPISTDGTAETHNVHAVGDEDWFKFTAVAGTTYTIQTSDLGVSADTYVYLYDTDSNTLLASNDDYGGSLASQIEWTAQTDGTYYVMVRHWNPNASGCGTVYNIAILSRVCHVGIEEIQTVAGFWRQTAGWPYDRDGDWYITVRDIMYWAAHWGESCQGTPLTLNFTTLVGGGRDNYQADITIDVRSPGDTTSLFRQTVQTDANGRYEGLILPGLVPGTYDVYAKGFVHLARKKTVELAVGVNEIDFSDGGTFKLPAGDITGDNVVDNDDYDYWVSVLGTDDRCADFDGSGKVTVLDYSSLLANWGKSGDGGTWGIPCVP